MNVARKLVDLLDETARAATVADVRIGLGYTAVELTDERTGVAYTFRDLASGGCSVFHGIRPLAGKSADQLLKLLASKDPIEAAVGLACANALANVPSPDQVEGDILDHLDICPDDDVAMIGNFAPIVGELRRRARSLTIYERVDAPTGGLRPQEEAPDGLAQCQVALITATAIINRTIVPLLDRARRCREVALLGASTPLAAQAFVGTTVTTLSGVVVQAPAEVLRVVSEGGGMRQFSRFVRKVNVKVPSCWPAVGTD